jgi:hypothetical protein
LNDNVECAAGQTGGATQAAPMVSHA